VFLKELEYEILKQSRNLFLGNEAHLKELCAKIFKTVNLVLEASCTARKEGLLELEEFANNQIGTSTEIIFLKDAILYIVDGTDPELVQDLVSTKLAIMDTGSLDCYLCYLIAKGCLMIQLGMNPFLIEEQIYASMPYSVSPEIKKMVRQEQRQFSESYRKHLVEKWNALEQQETDNPFLCLFEEKTKKYSDKDIQRILRDVDYTEIATLLIFCKPSVKEHFSKNISDNVKANIMDSYWYVNESELTNILTNVLKVCNKLEALGEITYDNVIQIC